ncbi:MAG: DUF5688 family protein [Defluviitaleaceae bacterium]|nr:DUF5688 family protein [Defluviitaleaceae bacterium]
MKVSLDVSSNMFEFIFDFMPALQAIYGIGFIPKPNEIVEFDENMYASHKRQTGEDTRPLYTVVPVNPKYLPDDNSAALMSSEEVEKLKKGIKFFKDYAKKNNLPNDSDTILKHAAKIMPDEIVEGTKFEKPKLRVLAENEKPKDSRDMWTGLMGAFINDNDIMSIKIKDETGLVREEVFSPSAEKIFDGNKMNYNEFKQYVVKSLSKIFTDDKYTIVERVRELPDDTSVEVIHVHEKREDGSEIGNGFHIGPCYNDYSLGKPLGDVILDMVKTVEEADTWTSKIDFNKLSEFDEVKNRLIIRPLNYNKNKKLLKGHVYRLNGDIAITLYMLMNNDASGLSTAKVERRTIEKWNLHENYIFDLAEENTLKNFKPYVVPIDIFLKGAEDADDVPDNNKFFMEQDFKLMKSVQSTYVLFLQDNINNATIPFINGTLQRLSEIMNDDLYLVIASMSYLVMHPQKSISLKQAKRNARNEKTNPYADPDEYLSDNVYLYTRADDTLKML